MRVSAAAIVIVLTAWTAAARAARVLMISIDGLRPGEVLDAHARGPKVALSTADGRPLF